MAKLNVLVYNGSGVSAASRDHTLRALRSFLAHRYDVQLVTPKSLRDEPWTNNCALLVFPGGRDLPYLFDLGGKANDRIRDWVRQGGRYLGICAGAYYACADIAFEVGTPLEVVGERELRFFPGSCRGTVFPGFQYDSDAGAREVEVTLNRAAWRDHWQQSPEACEVWYNGGGAFFLDSTTPSSSNVEVLATYSHIEGTPAAGVGCVFGAGKAVLWGTHPEHPSPPSADVAADLVKERNRLNTVRASLSYLGLDVSDAPAAAPRLLPLFLASDDLSLVERTAAALASRGEATESAQIRFADRNDTFLLHPASSAAQTLQDARDQPGIEDPEELQAEAKHIIVCDSASPPPSLTPLFDLSSYFSALRAARQGTAAPFGQLALYGEVVTSTQTMLDKNDNFLATLPTGLVCLASHQVAGRGRGGNSWISPAGCLQFSLVARLPNAQASKIVFIQYLFGLAVVEAIRGVPGYERLGVCLKWPNDIYADLGTGADGEGMERYRKIGGILVNSSFSDGTFNLVIGCGINTSNPRPTTSVNELVELHNRRYNVQLPPFTPERLLAVIMSKFGEMWEPFLRDGFEPFLDRYLTRWIHSDQIVTLETTSQPVRITSITTDHGLLRTTAIQLDRDGREIFGGSVGGQPQYIDLQPDGNRFDILKGLIYARTTAVAFPSRDRLSELPIEILTDIFELAYADQPSTGPLCRALLPLDRSRRFRRVKVEGDRQLVQLAKALESGSMAQWVDELELQQIDRDGGLALNERQFKAFFAALPSLSHLELGAGSQATLRLVLSNSLTRASLRSTTHLSFCALDDQKNPFEPAPFRLLPSYPSLRSLSISTDRKWHELHRVKSARRKAQPLPNVKELILKSEGADLPLVNRLVEACPSLESLTLKVTSHQPDFPPLLPSLPATLKSLELRTLAFYDVYSRPCDSLLSRFVNLEHLYLGEGTFSSAILGAVRSLPKLTSLGFGKSAVVSAKGLEALIDGPARFQQLKTLTLDIVEGKRGWSITTDGYYHLHPDAESPFWLGPGWVPPRFTRPDGDFYEKDVQSLIATAKASGVDVRGTTVEAVGIVDDFYRELGTCGDLHAIQTGDFSVLLEYCGEEYVKQLKLDYEWDEYYNDEW
ncbi:hypothetical protein JCM8097_007718 [Rhodosporidiobolus ruineniae]